MDRLALLPFVGFHGDGTPPPTIPTCPAAPLPVIHVVNSRADRKLLSSPSHQSLRVSSSHSHTSYTNRMEKTIHNDYANHNNTQPTLKDHLVGLLLILGCSYLMIGTSPLDVVPYKAPRCTVDS